MDYIITVGPRVRIRITPAASPSRDLIVEVFIGQWTEQARFNDMSDNMAYSNADDMAHTLRRKLIEGENI